MRLLRLNKTENTQFFCEHHQTKKFFVLVFKIPIKRKIERKKNKEGKLLPIRFLRSSSLGWMKTLLTLKTYFKMILTPQSRSEDTFGFKSHSFIKNKEKILIKINFFENFEDQFLTSFSQNEGKFNDLKNSIGFSFQTGQGKINKVQFIIEGKILKISLSKLIENYEKAFIKVMNWNKDEEFKIVLIEGLVQFLIVVFVSKINKKASFLVFRRFYDGIWMGKVLLDSEIKKSDE